jgi:predicted nucleic acid-binding protein
VNRVLECALAAQATVIVTGDRRHLLPLGSYEGIDILTPAHFLAQFSRP